MREAMVFVAGAVLGASIWALSPWLTSKLEPWDAQGAYYFAALFFSGLLAACISPSRFWVAPIGVYFGQVGYGVYGHFTGALPSGPMWIAGACMGLAFCAFALLGAAIPAAVAEVLRRRFPEILP